ncbi:YigZ family protein [Thalassomonas actiniarum]|uniref:YigZ family protein n=1 Tax=Thalassomonas actiniarum TaxID=485447 RepID=A0AAF0C315_9GAMM|nr:YigZ family protein [Thalassomonas actiniarum]WDD99127.1 YigZ family protein [Thalassomonas actiniarum]
MAGTYNIAASEVIDETIVTRSRFICYLRPCTSQEAAKAFIRELQQLHPQANHHCYAFVFGAPDDSQSYGFSDDGEPTGTAGKPMLAVLQGGGIGQICAVVVRYFGGTKLGTGGLQRAYGNSVRQALALMQTEVKVPKVTKALACQYGQVDDILHLLAQVKGEVTGQQYSEQVNLTLAIPEAELALFQQHLSTLSSGQLTLISVDH